MINWFDWFCLGLADALDFMEESLTPLLAPMLALLGSVIGAFLLMGFSFWLKRTKHPTAIALIILALTIIIGLTLILLKANNEMVYI